MIHQVISSVTARIRERSAARRQAFLARIQRQADQGKTRAALACGNLAHAVAASSCDEKGRILDMTRANVGIVTAYNDMLSAHQPYQGYPDIIKAALAELGHSAQVAGGVPAMCDGVTQGQPGMDMSLFSRDLIAQATALSLSHNTFDATLLLGICDKIAPGQIMGALSHAHLPTAFVPVGPMASGISNDEKVKVRQQYAAGEVGRDALLQMECGAYHAAGTCTFYGTANTNQLVFEAMGLMLPGSAFVHPHSELRRALTEEAARRISAMIGFPGLSPLSAVIDERSLVNGLVALLASGGSTNHSIHMVALARAAGLHLTWDDISDLSDVVPLLVRMYPNGPVGRECLRTGGWRARPDAPAGARRADPPGRHSGVWRDAGLPQPSGTGGWQAGMAAGGRERRCERAVAFRQRISGYRRHQVAGRQSGPRRGQGLRRGSRVSRHRGAGTGLLLPACGGGGLQGGRSQSGCRHRGAPQWPGRQRHAGAAQADAGARQPAEGGLQGGAGHRWPSLRRLRQDPPPSTSPRKRCTVGPSVCLPMATCCGWTR